LSLFSSLVSYLRGDDLVSLPSAISALDRRGAFDPDRQPDWIVQRAPDWSIDDPVILQDAVRKSVIIYACASYLADAASEAPLIPMRSVDGDLQPDDSRPGRLARSVLAAPNPHMSEAEFYNLLVFTMAIMGYGVVEKVRSGLGLPMQLWPLRPDWLKRRRRNDGTTDGWDYRAPRNKLRQVPDEDIIIVPFRHDWRFERYGIGPVQVAAREIGIDSSLTDFLKVFLDSGGIPPFVLLNDQPVNDEAKIEAMQLKWQEKYGGSKAYGKLPALHGGWKLQQIGGDLNSMAWPDLRGLTELKICQAFRVPAELVQAWQAQQGGDLTSTEMEGGMTALQRYGASPIRQRVEGAFTRGFLTEFMGDDAERSLQFDTSKILALQEDTDELHARVRADYNDGLIMLDEARVDIGMDPLPKKQGQIFKLPFTTILVPASGLSEELPPARGVSTLSARAGRRYRDLKALSKATLEQRASVLARTQRDRQRLTEIGARQLRRFWKAQGERIVAEATRDTGINIEARDIAAINWDEEEELLADVLLRFYDANGSAAAAAATATTGVSVDWTLANPAIQRVRHLLSQRIRGVNDTTRDDVQRIVTESLQEGVSLQELGERLTGLFEETYKGRSQTVARTESMVAYNSASAVTYAETGVVDDVELVDNPEHTESYDASDGLTCAERDGLVVALADVGRHIDAEHPNGSLSILPILSTPLGEE
jgi:HK97 family phage portal protein